MHYHIGSNAVDTEVTPSFVEANSSSSFDQGKHRLHNPSIGFPFYNLVVGQNSLTGVDRQHESREARSLYPLAL
jgi:hypothetical protein